MTTRLNQLLFFLSGPRGQPPSGCGLPRARPNPCPRLSTPSWDGGNTLGGNTFQAAVRGQPLAVRGQRAGTWQEAQRQGGSVPGETLRESGSRAWGAVRGPEKPPCLCLRLSLLSPPMPPRALRAEPLCSTAPCVLTRLVNPLRPDRPPASETPGKTERQIPRYAASRSQPGQGRKACCVGVRRRGHPTR